MPALVQRYWSKQTGPQAGPRSVTLPREEVDGRCIPGIPKREKGVLRDTADLGVGRMRNPPPNACALDPEPVSILLYTE